MAPKEAILMEESAYTLENFALNIQSKKNPSKLWRRLQKKRFGVNNFLFHLQPSDYQRIVKDHHC